MGIRHVTLPTEGLLKFLILLGEYSVKTDAVVRSVVVTFKFGDKVGETTVGRFISRLEELQ